MEKINYPNISNWKQIFEITKLQGCEIVDNFWYKLNIDYAPREIPLDQIFMDLKNFQNRKKPYSEHSVQNIIDAVLNWNFDFRIFNPIIVWKNSQDNKLYILSWHSRYEAFKRLSTEYKDYPKVIEFQKKTWYDFGNILCMIMDDISFHDARMISLISNALATIESDTERAEIYRNFRQLWQNKKFIGEFWRRCEKNNRPRIEAYSYLNPDGDVIGSLDIFENNTDEIHIIKRIAKWIWLLRMKHPELSDIHENELFDRLINKWWYGNKDSQINSQSKFIDVVSKHLEEIKNKWSFSVDSKLNILKIQYLSNAMREYYKLLDELDKEKQKAISEFHLLRRNLNKRIVNDVGDDKLEQLKIQITNDLGVVLDKLSVLEQIQPFIFDIRDFIDENNAKKVLKNIISHINRLEQDYYKLKLRRNRFVEASKSEITLNFF